MAAPPTSSYTQPSAKRNGCVLPGGHSRKLHLAPTCSRRNMFFIVGYNLPFGINLFWNGGRKTAHCSSQKLMVKVNLILEMQHFAVKDRSDKMMVTACGYGVATKKKN